MGDAFERSEDRVAVRDGLELHVIRWQPSAQPAASPGGPPFLLVHGLSSNARLWEGVGSRLAAAGHVAVAVDERGHGLSDKPDHGYDFETIDGDLARLIERLDLHRAVFAGQSWGGGVALDLAVRSPELLAGIVLVDGHAWDLQDDFATFDDAWERLAPPRVAGSPLVGVRQWFRTQHPTWSDDAIEWSLGNFRVDPDGRVDLWLTRDRHRQILQALWDQQPSQLWPRVSVPVLALVADTGQADWTAKKRAAMQRADQLLTTAGVPHEIRWVEADHDIHAQHPDLVADAMLEALDAGLFAAPETGATAATNVTP